MNLMRYTAQHFISNSIVMYGSKLFSKMKTKSQIFIVPPLLDSTLSQTIDYTQYVKPLYVLTEGIQEHY